MSQDSAGRGIATGPSFVQRQSFIEQNARERAAALFDPDTARELLGPFDRVESPWLPLQNVTPQADDGCVVMQGNIGGEAAVIVALEGAFQGGSLGEVSGAKLTTALDLACRDNAQGVKTHAVLLLETGGVRLQEANLGLAALAEIIGSLLALRAHVPVVCVTAGPVGCFGGLALVAGLASYILMTREARLGLNGPEVIEQEAGIDEFDSSDRALIWATFGGEQRSQTGLIDALVEDDVVQIAEAVRGFLQQGLPPVHRSAQVASLRSRIAALDPSRSCDPQEAQRKDSEWQMPDMNETMETRGKHWFQALTGQSAPLPGDPGSVWTADAVLGAENVRFLCVVPDAQGRFPRARQGEVGLEEALTLAARVREVMEADRNGPKRPIIAIVDVKSQAYGRREEIAGIHLATAAAADAYGSARLAGHPVIALVVGHAISGAFLAHSYQANRILAFDDAGVMIHAMHKEAAARITRRTVEEMEALGKEIAPLSYDIHDYAKLGLLHKLLHIEHPNTPQPQEVALVRQELIAAIEDARQGQRDLSHRLQSPEAQEMRKASLLARHKLEAQWAR
jgi:malonate decarboxylase beta subunit